MLKHYTSVPTTNLFTQKRRLRHQRLRDFGLPSDEVLPTADPLGIPPWTIGLDHEGEYLTLLPSQRTTLTHLLAIPETGKTTLMEHLAVSDAKASMGIVFVDAHGDATQNLLWRLVTEVPERLADVVLLDAADQFGLNPARCEDPTNLVLAQRAVNQFVHVFQATFGVEGSEGSAWGPQLAQILRNVARLLVANTATMAEVPFLITQPERRARLLARVPTTGTGMFVHHFWEEQFGKWPERVKAERVQSTLNKVDAFLTDDTVHAMVTQAGKSLSFSQLIAARKIVIVSLQLPTLGENAVSLLGSTILGEIFTASLARQHLLPHERHLTMLYLDEVQLFQTPDLAAMIAQVRKFGIGIVQANQFLYQLTDKMRAAVLTAANFIAGQVSSLDADAVAGKFNNAPIPGEDEYKPIMVNAGSHYEQARAWYGRGWDAESFVKYQRQPGKAIEVDQVRARRANELVNLPAHDFAARIREGREMAEYRFHGRSSPLHGPMPAPVAEAIAQIRQRTIEAFVQPVLTAPLTVPHPLTVEGARKTVQETRPPSVPRSRKLAD